MGCPDCILELMTLYGHRTCSRSVENGGKISVFIH